MAQWPAGSALASEDRKEKEGDNGQQITRYNDFEGEEGQKRGQLDVAVQAAAHLKSRPESDSTDNSDSRSTESTMHQQHIDTLQRIVHIDSYFKFKLKLVMLRIKRYAIQ